MKKIKGLFVRHGLSEANVSRTLVGFTDVPLSEKGRLELEEIKKKDLYPKTDIYFSSDLKRAKSTAQILFGENGKINLREGFRELYFGSLEGVSFDELDFDDLFNKWYQDIYAEGMESYDEFYTRIKTALDSVIKEVVSAGKESFTVVSHSCTMRMINLYLENLDKTFFFTLKFKNAHGFEAEIDYDESIEKIIAVSLKIV